MNSQPNKSIINLIQDLATPHNNELIGHFKNYDNVILKLWYAQDQDLGLYQWSKSLTNEHFPAQIYGKSFNWNFIKYCLKHKDEKFVIVGWMNINTRILYFFLFLLRRPFNHWSDCPASLPLDSSLKKRLSRYLSYLILKKSKSKIFCVGKTAISYFQNLGFSESRLINLPIFVNSEEDILAYHAKRQEISNTYSIDPEDFVLSAGSRLIHEKGYDLLIKAISLLQEELRKKIKVMIVGSGNVLGFLEKIVEDLKLTDQIVFIKWVAIQDFKALIANSDVFIHPARFDAYGGTILGMSLGVTVVGSYGAGAAVDRINQGLNGFLYEAKDVQTLSNLITLLYQNPELRKRMGNEAIKTAKAWHPRRGVEIIIKNSI